MFAVYSPIFFHIIFFTGDRTKKLAKTIAVTDRMISLHVHVQLCPAPDTVSITLCTTSINCYSSIAPEKNRINDNVVNLFLIYFMNRHYVIITLWKWSVFKKT